TSARPPLGQGSRTPQGTAGLRQAAWARLLRQPGLQRADAAVDHRRDSARDCGGEVCREGRRSRAVGSDRRLPGTSRSVLEGERNMRKRITFALLVVLVAPLALVGCGQTKADVASHNLSVAAEQFQVARRIVAINGITDKYLLEIVGY